MIVPPSRPSNAVPNATTLFSTTVLDTGADETVLDTQSIPDPVVSVRHHHSFAQIIIRWNCFCGIKSLLRPTPKYLVRGAARGSDQTSSKQNPNDDCDFREKVDVSKRQGDEMAIFSFHVQLCNPGKQYSLNGAPPLNIPVGLVSGISGVHKSGSGASSARRRATRGFFLEIADVAREHQTHDQPTESGKLFVGQHVSPSLGVCRPWRRRNESKCHASRCKCQWHTGWLCLCPFLTNSCPQISAEPDFESPRAVSRPRAFCRALSHLQARSTQMAPCLCITCVHSVL